MELEQKNCQQKASYDRIAELEQLNSLLDRQVMEFQHTLNGRNSTYELLQSNHISTLAELEAKEREMQQLNMQKGESRRALAGLNADYGRGDQLQSNHDAAVAELEASKSETGHLKTLLNTQERESQRTLAALNAKYDQLQSSHAAALAEARGRPDAAPTNELSLLRDLEKKGKQLDHMRDLLQHSGMLLWLLCCCCGSCVAAVLRHAAAAILFTVPCSASLCPHCHPHIAHPVRSVLRLSLCSLCFSVQEQHKSQAKQETLQTLLHAAQQNQQFQQAEAAAQVPHRVLSENTHPLVLCAPHRPYI